MLNDVHVHPINRHSDDHDHHNYRNDHNETTKKRRRIFVRLPNLLQALSETLDLKISLQTANMTNITVNDLMIPDTYCSKNKGSGYQCPKNFTCTDLDLSHKEQVQKFPYSIWADNLLSFTQDKVFFYLTGCA